MEELQVIETTSGRQFKPWVDADKLQQIVRDPASVTAIASEIASGKQAIAQAINAKGGSASATESFTELAEAVEEIPNFSDMARLAGIIAGGNYDKNALQGHNENVKYGKTEIVDILGVFETINITSCFQYWDLIERVNMPNLNTISGGGVFKSCSSLQEVSMPNLTTISGGNVFQSCSSLQEVSMPNLTTTSGGAVFQSCSSLQRIEFPNLRNWTTASKFFNNCPLLEDFIAPILSNYSQGYYGPFFQSINLKNIVVGTLTNGCFSFTENIQNNLRNITIGQDTNINLTFQNWNAANVIGEGQSGIDELNSNLQTNLIAKLYQGGGKILRLGTTLYDVTTQETRDMVTAKGWTLQRG